MPDLKNESNIETIKWRQKKLSAWAQFTKDRDAFYKTASKSRPASVARTYAAEQIRRPCREFLYDVLRRASQSAALDFLRNLPIGAVEKTEKLLDESELVPRLIRRSYPAVMPWAQNIRLPDNGNLKNTAEWSAWLKKLGEPLGYEVVEAKEAKFVPPSNPLITKAVGLGPYVAAAVPYLIAAGVGTIATVIVLRGDKRNGA